MPETIEWPPPSRRLRRLLIALAVLFFVVFLGGQRALSYYVDALRFGSLGYGDVFRRTVFLQWGLFLGFALATFGLLYGTFLLLRHTHAADLPGRRSLMVNGQSLKLNIEPLLKPLGLLVSALIAFLTASGMTSEWPAFARWWFAPHAAEGILDPIFGRPLSFYLLKLPAYDLLADWLMTVAICAVGLSILFLVLTARNRVSGDTREITNPARWRGLSLTLAFLLLVLAIRVYLSRFEQLFEDHTIFSGVTYVDAHVTLTGMLLTCLALVLGAAIAVSGGLRDRGGRSLVAAVLPSVGCFLLFQVIGWFVSSFIVKPNELVKEQPYISHNIEFTRQAYGLDRI